MFSKKIPTLFISRNFVEPGLVTLSRTPVFEGSEALSYTQETLHAVLAQIPLLKGGSVRIVLSEELVYVAALSFPLGTKLTRELVRVRAEETIPEDLRTTDWDFRTMHFVKHDETAEQLLVQVAVIERGFTTQLETALQSQAFTVESILPESYVLASFEAHEAGVTVIVEQDRENILLVACEVGLVFATEIKKGELIPEDISRFLSFVSERTTKNVSRVFFSHMESPICVEAVTNLGLPCEERSYNPLFGAALEKTSGKDAAVLNLNIFPGQERLSWWNRFFKKTSR